MITDPVTVHPDQKIGEALQIMERYRISGVPVVVEGHRLVGILTNRDLRFEKRLDRQVREVMTTRLITARPGISLDEAKSILQANRIEKLPLVDEHMRLRGLITVKDMDKATRHPNSSKDAHGRLRAGAAIGVGPDREQRVAALLRAGADVLLIDTAHGHSQNVIDALRVTKREAGDIEVIAGNVATSEGSKALMDAGADALRVGIGPGSICTTRVVSGVGVPQMTAIMDCVAVARAAQHPDDRGWRRAFLRRYRQGARGRSIHRDDRIADCGYRGEPGRDGALSGAHLQGISRDGIDWRDERARARSLHAARCDRRRQDRARGRRGARAVSWLTRIEHRTTYRRPAGRMGYVGAHSLGELRRRAKFIRVSEAGQRESHVHDVFITKESPNYRG